MSKVHGLWWEVSEGQVTPKLFLINTITQLGKQVKGIILLSNLIISIFFQHLEKLEEEQKSKAKKN